MKKLINIAFYTFLILFVASIIACVLGMGLHIDNETYMHVSMGALVIGFIGTIATGEKLSI